MLRRYLAFALAALLLVSGASAQVLHTSSRWILNSSNQRVKFRCVNWAGHMETSIPEGLQHQSVSTIASWISSNGFNCVRLTYSIDMALNPSQSVSASFTAAANSTGVSASAMQTLYNSVVSHNSWISSATTQSTYARVIDELGSRGVMVILDNHVSHASWCCGTSDGNGWWSSASGYDQSNSRYFDTSNWLSGLKAMATFAASHSNVVGMSLRNELRAVGSQDGNNHADWYTYVGQGASAIHSANTNLLIIVGGVNYAINLSYLYSNPLNRSSFSDKVVWEFHHYQWSLSVSSCSDRQTQIGNLAGYLLVQNKTYTGPLWLSEFGWNLASPTSDEISYRDCLVQYMTSNDADWSVWALQGSYYVRSATVNYDETFGVLNKDWSGWRDSNFKTELGAMFSVTQGP